MDPNTDSLPDEAVLFPELEVAGHKIRPWSLAQAVELAPYLGHVRKLIQEEGITFENISDKWMVLIERGSALLPKLVSVSVGMTEKEAGELMLDDAGAILAGVVSCNWRYLKNSLRLGQTVVAAKMAH